MLFADSTLTSTRLQGLMTSTHALVSATVGAIMAAFRPKASLVVERVPHPRRLPCASVALGEGERADKWLRAPAFLGLAKHHRELAHSRRRQSWAPFSRAPRRDATNSGGQAWPNVSASTSQWRCANIPTSCVRSRSANRDGVGLSGGPLQLGEARSGHASNDRLTAKCVEGRPGSRDLPSDAPPTLSELRPPIFGRRASRFSHGGALACTARRIPSKLLQTTHRAGQDRRNEHRDRAKVRREARRTRSDHERTCIGGGLRNLVRPRWARVGR
jgi:hypothetical protein